MNVLEVRSATVRFAGLRALHDVSLSLLQGEILGLIGPNGAGKSTLINVISGFQPATGEVILDGLDVTDMNAVRRTRAGLGRTFQDVRLFEDMTTRDNLVVSAIGAGKGRRDAEAFATEIAAQLDLADLMDLTAGSLPYGIERRLGLARAIMGEPKVVLLDEPAAGLNEQESDALVELLPAIRDRWDCSVLVVEHDMRLIFRVCERIHVLDHGETIAMGPPAEIRSDPRVIEAYLGTEEVA